MSSIGLFGGRGTSEEILLQALKYQYTALDEIDVAQTKEYRCFKFLIFPSRLFFYARGCADAIRGNTAFQGCMARFLERGGRILLCPPLSLPSDFDQLSDDGGNCFVVNWLPVGPITLRRRPKRRVTLQIRKPNHPLCAALTGKKLAGIYSYFENTSDAEVLISTPGGLPLIAEIPMAAGSVIMSAIEFLDPGVPPSSDVTGLFRPILRWGQDVPSIAVTFDSLCTRLRDRKWNQEAHLMEKADQSLLSRCYGDACGYASKAFERILRAKANSGDKLKLHEVIDQLFQETKRSDPRHSFCQGIRAMRNADAHGKRSPEEFTVEETECLFSAIKFVISGLL
jgi:hypothetical protein